MEVLFLIALLVVVVVVLFLGELGGLQIAYPAGLLLATILTILFVYWIKREKRENDADVRRAAEWEEEQEEEKRRLDLRSRLHIYFQIDDPFKVSDPACQKEMVRLVNLWATRLAEACVKQTSPKIDRYWADVYVHQCKEKWDNLRNLALEVCPSLENELPHFSEFEPLKSYNEEYRLKKQAKKA